MKNVVHAVVQSVRGTRLRRVAHLALACVPDREVTRNVKLLGPMRYRLRRHFYFWAENVLPSHGVEFGMFRALIRPGDVVYDIGANVGMYARFLVQHFGAGKVFCFEPMTENAALLKANLSLAPDPSRGRAFQMALSDTDGEADLQVDDVTSGSAVLNEVAHGEASAGRKHKNLPPKTERVIVRRLDALVAEENLPGPSFIKIDTEGAAAHVIRGGRATIDRHSPRMLIGLHGDEEARPLLEDLAKLGYACFGHGGGERGYRELTATDLPADKCDIACSRVRADVEREPPIMRDIPADWR